MDLAASLGAVPGLNVVGGGDKRAKFLAAIVKDLRAAGTEALVVAGVRQPAVVHAIAAAINDSLKSSMAVQGDAVKKQLSGAVTDLESAQKHASEGVKATGQAFQTSVRQTLADARASVQKVSEAVATNRAGNAA